MCKCGESAALIGVCDFLSDLTVICASAAATKVLPPLRNDEHTCLALMAGDAREGKARVAPAAWEARLSKRRHSAVVGGV